MHNSVDISVVIGFKDWGSERLLVSIRSILQSFGTLSGEVIVSDYGSESTNASKLKQAVEAAGARYVYTSTNGIWSRSRALNAGFAESTGKVLVSTDADMLFTPASMEIIGRRVLDNPNEAVVLQCRDLPERLSVEAIDPLDFAWQEYAESSTLRPRWGMGGMMAVSRDMYLTVRGFDERMQIYGGEDMDFAQRVRRAGCRLVWLNNPEVRMYHIWHPSSRQDAVQTAEGAAAIRHNREIFQQDASYIRNTRCWQHKPADARPLASVVIATRNRADYIAESIYSVLNQTVQDLEIIIVDDGSTDNTEDVVRRIGDPRIRYFRREPAGIAASRNFAATVTSADFTVIHDDDDIMFPDRIENHFKALAAGVSGTYGGWIDFQNNDASDCAAIPGREFSLPALLFSSKVYAHATLMLRTELIRQIPYDEHLRSGSDYNLAIRLARSGVKMVHTGHFHLIRRLHNHQVTAADSSVQKSSARISSGLVLRTLSADSQQKLKALMKALPYQAIKGSEKPYELIAPYLPDHLIKRRIRFTSDQLAKLPSSFIDEARMKMVDVTNKLDGQTISSYGEMIDVRWKDMAALTAMDIPVEIEVIQAANTSSCSPSDSNATIVADLIDTAESAVVSNRSGILIVSGPAASLPAMLGGPVAELATNAPERPDILARVYELAPSEFGEMIHTTLRGLSHEISARYVPQEGYANAWSLALEGVVK